MGYRLLFWESCAMSFDNGGAPLAPPLEELEKLFTKSPNAAKDYVDYWFEQRKAYDELAIERLRDEIASNRHKRFFSVLSVILGTVLASASLMVCVYGIYAKASLWELSLFLAPVSGLAGIFLWGYRPKDP
jgi:hypothetical protein